MLLQEQNIPSLPWPGNWQNVWECLKRELVKDNITRRESFGSSRKVSVVRLRFCYTQQVLMVLNSKSYGVSDFRSQLQSSGIVASTFASQSTCIGLKSQYILSEYGFSSLVSPNSIPIQEVHKLLEDEKKNQYYYDGFDRPTSWSFSLNHQFHYNFDNPNFKLV